MWVGWWWLTEWMNGWIAIAGLAGWMVGWVDLFMIIIKYDFFSFPLCSSPWPNGMVFPDICIPHRSLSYLRSLSLVIAQEKYLYKMDDFYSYWDKIYEGNIFSCSKLSIRWIKTESWRRRRRGRRWAINMNRTSSDGIIRIGSQQEMEILKH